MIRLQSKELRMLNLRRTLLIRLIPTIVIAATLNASCDDGETREQKVCRTDLPPTLVCPSAESTEDYFEEDSPFDGACLGFASVVDGPEINGVTKQCCYTVEVYDYGCALL
jgi:hypothetical protein